MLGYMEQQPLYNAANFSWAVVMGPGWTINTTVSNSIINTFLCPSDNLAPSPVPAGDQWSGRLNNYFASVGTTLAYQGATRYHGGLHPGGQSLRRSEHHRRDLQYDRVRRSLGRPGCRGYHSKSAAAALPEWHQYQAGSPAGLRTISTTPARTYTAVLADMQDLPGGRTYLPGDGNARQNQRGRQGGSGGRPTTAASP